MPFEEDGSYDGMMRTEEGRALLAKHEADNAAFLNTVCVLESLTKEEFIALPESKRIALVAKHMMTTQH